MSVLSWSLEDAPLVVVDVETTGLRPGHDRVIEVATVLVPLDPHDEPEVLVDSLVNPGRPVDATHIHGIADADVAGAPRFEEVAGQFGQSITDSLVVAHNASFDIGFLEYEFSCLGIDLHVPYACSMYLAPLLRVGTRASLQRACAKHRIPYLGNHAAVDDAISTARLVSLYRSIALKRGLGSLQALHQLGRYKFLDSWRREPLSSKTIARLPRSTAARSRSAASAATFFA